MKNLCFLFLSLLMVLQQTPCSAQVAYGAAAAYGLRKINPAYTGKAVQVKRTCDNATGDIGFNACGNLDTVALKTFVMAANPLSAISSTADAVYSLRKMRCSYAGSAIRVRSSAAGSPTLDIGFTTAGDLDTAALKTFVGANSAFVTTWYDQSGNAYDASQTTTGAQPQIVNAGAIDRQNGKPAILFDGSATVLLNNTYSMLINSQSPTWNAVAVPISPNDVYSAIVCWRVGGGVENALEFGPGGNWNTSWWSNTNYNLTNGLSVAYGSFQILTSLYNSTSNQLYLNGTLSYSNTGQSNPAATSTSPSGSGAATLRIGNDNCCGGRFVKGYIIEIVMSPTNFSATDRQFLEWSQAQYYSVNGPVLSTLPATPASASVSIWYDQSGNGKDAVQSTAGNQPAIVNAGVIQKNNGQPALSFAGFPQNLVAPLSTSVYPLSISVLGNTSGGSSGGAFIKHGTNINGTQGGIAIGIGNSGGLFDNSGTSVIGLKEWAAWCPSSPNVNYPSNPFTSTTIQQSGGTLNNYLNGTNIPLSSSATAVGTSMIGNLFIGGYTNTANRYAVVNETEVIVFPSALSATARILLETNQATYDGITITDSKYTPPTASSYLMYVNGVGRESATDSVAGTRSTVGMGFLIGQTATDFLKDNGDYLTAGIDCPVAAAISTLNLPATIVQRWNNDWYLNKTDVNSNNGTINFFFDFSDYGMTGTPGVAANYELLARSSAAGTFSIVSGTTKSVSGDRISFAVDAAAISNGYYTVGTKSTSASPLPIELSAFNISCVDNRVQLSWTTATETDNAYFIVERTADGVNYETLARIKGAGNSRQKQNYEFLDLAPIKGISYYRLKQQDYNGQEKTYKLVEISCNTASADIRIYPNPADGIFKIEGAPSPAHVRVYNSMGLLVAEHTQEISGVLNLATLPDGIYFIALDTAPGQVQKLVIRH